MQTEPEPAHGTSLFCRLLVGIVLTACRAPKSVLAVALLMGGVSLYAACTRLEYRTERSDLVSPRKGYQQRWRQYLAEFGEDDDIVVVVQGGPRPRMQAALEALAERVQKEPLCHHLFYKVDLRPLHNRALLFLSRQQIEQIQNNLGSMRLLLEFGPLSWRSLTLLSLLREARHRAGSIQPGEPLKPVDEQFLTQLLSISRSAVAAMDGPGRYRNPWGSLLTQQPEQKDLLAEPQYFFSGDETLAFLLVRPVKETGSFTGCQKSVDAVRALVAATRPAFPELEFGMTGLPVLETDEMVAAQRDTRTACYLAIAGVSVLFLIVYRGIYYPMLTVATLLLGTSWAMGWTTLTVGHLNILSATFAVMLIGMGDYGVLWVMRYERERRRGATVEAALQQTAICVGAGTLTAALTTAFAFFAAMLADFQAVSELGWIAGSGVLLCALACFSVLPAVLKLADRRDFQTETNSSWGRHYSTGFGRHFQDDEERSSAAILSFLARKDTWLPGLAGQSGWVMGITVCLTLFMAVCSCRVCYDHNLLHLQARDLDSVKWELTLNEHTAGATWHALSYTASPEDALALKARYEKLPEVSRVVEVASLVPADQDKKIDLMRDIRSRLHNLPERGATIPHSRPSFHELHGEMACLVGQLQPLADASPQPLLADLRQGLKKLYDKLDDMPAVGLAEERVQAFEESMAGDLAADLHRLRDVSTPLPITLADLPSALRDRYIGKTGKWLLQVFGKDCLWDFEPLQHFATRIAEVDSQATGKPFATVEGLQAMKNGFQWAGLYAFLAIIAVLACDFRNPGRTLIALSPLAVGITLALGVMGLCGLPLNPANMIALPLVLGVGVDNGVHILHDHLAYKAEGERTLSGAIGRGVFVKALTTMIGFGTLMISSQRGLAGLGFCLTLGVGCCMATALIFLPALLRLVNAKSQRRLTVDSPSILHRAA
jgi:hopanoid biosynthesis associated RND transporter like protein HpnN